MKQEGLGGGTGREAVGQDVADAGQMANRRQGLPDLPCRPFRRGLNGLGRAGLGARRTRTGK